MNFEILCQQEFFDQRPFQKEHTKVFLKSVTYDFFFLKKNLGKVLCQEPISVKLRRKVEFLALHKVKRGLRSTSQGNLF